MFCSRYMKKIRTSMAAIRPLSQTIIMLHIIQTDLMHSNEFFKCVQQFYSHCRLCYIVERMFKTIFPLFVCLPIWHTFCIKLYNQNIAEQARTGERQKLCAHVKQSCARIKPSIEIVQTAKYITRGVQIHKAWPQCDHAVSLVANLRH